MCVCVKLLNINIGRICIILSSSHLSLCPMGPALLPSPPANPPILTASGLRAHWLHLLVPLIKLSRALSSFSASHPDSLCVSVIITASHNPWQDNGVKVVINGHLPTSSQIKYLNSSPPAATTTTVLNIYVDTRFTSPFFARLLSIHYSGPAKIHPCPLTTPAAHWLCGNPGKNPVDWASGLASSFSKLYDSILHLTPRAGLDLNVDCAYGSGSSSLRLVSSLLLGAVGVRVLGYNVYEPGPEVNDAVNEGCGSEFVQKGRRRPKVYVAQTPPIPASGTPFEEGFNVDVHNCSFDGDGDRVVFYSSVESNPFRVYDGTRLSCLFVLRLLPLCQSNGLTIGVVQTAYSNGASLSWLKARGVPVATVKTGVMYAHEAAGEWDVGIYFEANGHGSVRFSDGAKGALPEEER